jgi:hypothetical protein
MHEDVCCPWNNRRRNTVKTVVLLDLECYCIERGEVGTDFIFSRLTSCFADHSDRAV